MSAEAKTPQHHAYSASGSSGWIACPGKPAMEEGKPDGSSPYADLGSAAHYLAALCLTSGRNPEDYHHNGIVCWELPDGRDGQVLAGDDLPDGAVERSMHKIDKSMVDNVTGYVNDVRARAKGGTLLVEQRVEFGASINLPGAFGTADAVILSADGSELIIEDYKNGYLEVDAEYNPQLMLYALGVVNQVSADVIELSPADMEVVVETLANPPEANERQSKAINEHKRRVVTVTEVKGGTEYSDEEMDDILKSFEPELFEKPKKKAKKDKEVVEIKPCTVRTKSVEIDDFEFDEEDL